MRAFVQSGLTLFVLASLLIHLSLWTALRLSPTPVVTPQTRQIEITVLDERPDEPNKKLQIVEQSPKALNDEVPEDAKYLSAHNQRVVHETRAVNTGDFKNTAHKKNSLAKPAKAKLADLLPKFDPTLPREASAPAQHPKKSEDEQSPSEQQEASQSNDYLKDTPSSLETLLSTREFVYYSYYQRIRTQIRQFWEPSIRAKVKRIFAQGRSIASERDHITRVIIILDQHGGLLGVRVVGESGVKDLDDAAVDAFRAAEPFPNPPKGIVEPDGTIKINWDFILEANNNWPSAKPQRYARSTW